MESTAYFTRYNTSDVSISTAGKLSVKPSLRFAIVSNMRNKKVGIVCVTAKAKDGSGVLGRYYVQVADPTVVMVAFGSTSIVGQGMTPEKQGKVSVEFGLVGNMAEPDFTVTSSNVKVASGIEIVHDSQSYDSSAGVYYNFYTLYIKAEGKGSATVTVKANDGSNKKLSWKITVK